MPPRVYPATTRRARLLKRGIGASVTALARPSRRPFRSCKPNGVSFTVLYIKVQAFRIDGPPLVTAQLPCPQSPCGKQLFVISGVDEHEPTCEGAATSDGDASGTVVRVGLGTDIVAFHDESGKRGKLEEGRIRAPRRSTMTPRSTGSASRGASAYSTTSNPLVGNERVAVGDD